MLELLRPIARCVDHPNAPLLQLGFPFYQWLLSQPALLNVPITAEIYNSAKTLCEFWANSRSVPRLGLRFGSRLGLRHRYIMIFAEHDFDKLAQVD